MRRLLIVVFSIFLPAICLAQPNFTLERIEKPDNPEAIPLYAEDEIEIAEPPESWMMLTGNFWPGHVTKSRVARNTQMPTITPVLPDPEKATGAAVIIAPGGAFISLSMDGEGFIVAERLAQKGIAAFVLQYRLNETPDDVDEFTQFRAERMAAAADPDKRDEVSDNREPRAIQDGLRAIALVRERAADWQVDPERVGFIGFSAGAMVGLRTVLNGEPQQVPDFLGYIYGPMSEVDVPEQAPPLFVAIAMNDRLFSGQGFDIVNSWRDAKKGVELHAYERGGHGFGPGIPGTTTTLVLDQFEAWLQMHGFVK